MKICKRCKTNKPLSDYTKKASRPDGLDDWCIECNRKERKIHYEANKNSLNENNRQYYQENKEVLSEKSKKYYHENIDEQRLKSLIYYHEHKEEKAEYAKDYHKLHKDKLRADNREWKENNKEKIKKTRKNYVEKNKEKIAIRSKLYRKNNKEKVLEIKRNYFKNNKEKINIARRKWRETESGKLSKLNSRHKRRFQKMQTADGSLPLKVRYPLTKELQQLLDDQNNICYFPNCDTYISRELGNIHLEHKIPLNKGGTHTIDNVAWSCAKCNLKKGG